MSLRLPNGRRRSLRGQNKESIAQFQALAATEASSNNENGGPVQPQVSQKRKIDDTPLGAKATKRRRIQSRINANTPATGRKKRSAPSDLLPPQHANSSFKNNGDGVRTPGPESTAKKKQRTRGSPRTARKSVRKSSARKRRGAHASSSSGGGGTSSASPAVATASQLEQSERLKAKGNASFANKEYSKAIKEYTLAMQLNPSNSSMLLSNRAAAYMMQQRHELAITDCEAALQMGPWLPRIKLRAARACLALGRTEQAIMFIKGLLDGEPSIGQHDTDIAALKTDAQHLSKQIKTYQDLVTQADDLLANEDVKDALAMAERARAMAPCSRDIAVLSVSAELLQCATTEAQSTDAVENAKVSAGRSIRAMNLNVQHGVKTLVRYGQILLRCALTNECQVFFECATQLDPTDANAKEAMRKARAMDSYLRRGIADFHARKCDAALSLFDAALNVDPTNAAYNCRMHYRKSAAHLAMHLYSEALADCDQALRIMPSYVKARTQRGKVLVSLGRRKDALVDLEIAYAKTKSVDVKNEIMKLKRGMNGMSEGHSSTSSAGSSAAHQQQKNMPHKRSNPFEQQQQQARPHQQRQRQQQPERHQGFRQQAPPGAAGVRGGGIPRPGGPAGPAFNTRSSAKKTGEGRGGGSQGQRRRSPRFAANSGRGKDDLYVVLGVGASSSKSSIKTAYRKLALKYHPDKNKSPSAEARFKEVAHAYSVLSSPKGRAGYDAKCVVNNKPARSTAGTSGRWRQPVF